MKEIFIGSYVLFLERRSKLCIVYIRLNRRLKGIGGYNLCSP